MKFPKVFQGKKTTLSLEQEISGQIDQMLTPKQEREDSQKSRVVKPKLTSYLPMQTTVVSFL
ncbi:hypothetical protein HDV02_005872 [Globomyces sp. JEL0801]|nr:hypothetical protein HDV02_005872 [Globomyces sp. JEL0801]